MNMKKFLFALMAITVAFASCQKDDNDGGNDNGGNGNEGGGNGSDTEQTVTLEDLTSGMLVINGEQTPLTGIFVDAYSGYMMVTMTDVPGPSPSTGSWRTRRSTCRSWCCRASATGSST